MGRPFRPKRVSSGSMPAHVPASADGWALWLFASVLFAACAASVAFLVWMGG